MTTFAHTLNRAAEFAERSKRLDPWAHKLADVTHRLLPDEDAAAPLRVAGQPLHPALVLAPAGSWAAASVLDVIGGKQSRVAARRLVALGLVASVPAGRAGFRDWQQTEGTQRRLGLIHLGLNSAAVLLYTRSWLLRHRNRMFAAKLAALGGAAVIATSARLGGQLADALGMDGGKGVPTLQTDRLDAAISTSLWVEPTPEV